MDWKDMLVMGGKVSAEWQDDAWSRAIASGSPADLEKCLSQTGPVIGRDAGFPEDFAKHWYISEISNRMRQRARKAGEAACDGKPRAWRFCAQPLHTADEEFK